MNEQEPISFISGQIEYSGSNDPTNYRGTNRLSIPSRKFGLSSAQEIVMRRIQEDQPKTIHIMLPDRSRIFIESSEFIKAKSSPQARAEVIESVAARIRNSKLVCIEEGRPRLENPSSSSPGGPQTLFEEH